MNPMGIGPVFVVKVRGKPDEKIFIEHIQCIYLRVYYVHRRTC